MKRETPKSKRAKMHSAKMRRIHKGYGSWNKWMDKPVQERETVLYDMVGRITPHRSFKYV